MNTPGGSKTGALVAAAVYGSIWGLAEATLGHLLHLARVPGLPGLVMVPFAVLVMGRVLARTGSAAAVLATGVIAAGSKFFDLLLPGTDILAVINPAQAIILEALAASVWASLVKREVAPLFLRSAINDRPRTGASPFFWPDAI